MKSALSVAIMLNIGLSNSALAEEIPSNAALYKMLLELKAKNQQLQDKLEEVILNKPTLATRKKNEIPLNAFLDKGSLKIKSSDDKYEYLLDGRIMLDAGGVNTSKDYTVKNNNIRTNTEFRRARLSLKTKMGDWRGEFDIDFVGGDIFDDDDELDTDTNAIEIKDMWIAYNGFDNTSIKIGNHKPYFSLAESTTSRWYNFMETPIVTDAFAPGRHIGLGITHWDKNHFIGSNIFSGNDLNERPTDVHASIRYGWSLRGIYRPIMSTDNKSVFHVGVNLMSQKPSSSDVGDSTGTKSNKWKIKNRPEAHFVDYKFLDTGKIYDVDKILTSGFEMAYKRNRFYMEAEYMETDLVRSGDSDLEDASFNGWYTAFNYFLTADHRIYDPISGEFAAVHPSSSFGALELGLRFSTLDLNDVNVLKRSGKEDTIQGGRANNITLGLNWYINNNYMMRVNYIHVDHDNYADVDGDQGQGGDNDLNILGLRLQVLF